MVSKLALKPMSELDLEDGYRVCARVDCNNSFKPKSKNATNDDVTEYYCSSSCATKSFFERRGMPLPAKTQEKEEKREINREAKSERMKVLREKLAKEGRLPKPTRRNPEGVPSREVVKEAWEGATPVGEEMRYLGGSKAAWLPDGSIVKVLGHAQVKEAKRYIVLVPQNGKAARRTVLGSKFLEPLGSEPKKRDRKEELAKAAADMKVLDKSMRKALAPKSTKGPKALTSLLSLKPKKRGKK